MGRGKALGAATSSPQHSKRAAITSGCREKDPGTLWGACQWELANLLCQSLFAFLLH